MNDRQPSVACLVLHRDEYGNRIACPGYPHAARPPLPTFTPEQIEALRAWHEEPDVFLNDCSAASEGMMCCIDTILESQPSKEK